MIISCQLSQSRLAVSDLTGRSAVLLFQILQLIASQWRNTKAVSETTVSTETNKSGKKKAWSKQKEVIKVWFRVKSIPPFGRWGPKRKKILCKLFFAFVVFSFNACNYIILHNDFFPLQKSIWRGAINDRRKAMRTPEKLSRKKRALHLHKFM